MLDSFNYYDYDKLINYRPVITIISIKIIKISLFCWLTAMVTIAQAQTTFYIVDQNNNPLENAVIELSNIENRQVKIQPYIMDQVDKAFTPHVLLVPSNSKVSFPNSDDIRHHVYSFSSVKPFELKLYAGQPKDPIIFENPGIAVLGCNIHDAMVGYIYIYESGSAYKTDKTGKVTIAHTISAASEITVWHPRLKQGVNFKQKLDSSAWQRNKNQIKHILDVTPPEPRDSFEDMFHHAK